MQTFTDLATAAYCPRQLYYRRRNDDYDPPTEMAKTRQLAFQYEHLLDSETDLTSKPIEVTPIQFRTNLGRAKANFHCWEELANPPQQNVLLDGKDCRGIAHKRLSEPLAPTIVSSGEPPEQGVWKPQSVRAIAAMKALAWEHEVEIDRAFVEYPAYGIVRTVRPTTRKKAAYRRALGVARSIDGPPPRLRNDSRCETCEYRTECGTRRRSLRSRLSL